MCLWQQKAPQLLQLITWKVIWCVCVRASFFFSSPTGNGIQLIFSLSHSCVLFPFSHSVSSCLSQTRLVCYWCFYCWDYISIIIANKLYLKSHKWSIHGISAVLDFGSPLVSFAHLTGSNMTIRSVEFVNLLFKSSPPLSVNCLAPHVVVSDFIVNHL